MDSNATDRPETVVSALEGYSLQVLAGMAGLRSVEPLERLLRSPRYQERLSRFATAKGSDGGGGSDAARSRLLHLSFGEWQTLFAGLGLCWGLARLAPALSASDIARVCEGHAMEAVHFAKDGLSRVAIAPAVAVSPGLEGLSPENCLGFGRMAFLGWLAEAHPDLAPLLSPVLGTEEEAATPRRLATLDPLIETFLNGTGRAAA